MTETILANAILVLPDQTLRGQIRLSQERILDIAEGAEIPAGAIDCAGDLVVPGLIALHTDNLERHIEPHPKVDWPQAAAPADVARLPDRGHPVPSARADVIRVANVGAAGAERGVWVQGHRVG